MYVRTVFLMTLVLMVGVGCRATVAPETAPPPTATELTATITSPATPSLSPEGEAEETDETPAPTLQPTATSTSEPTPGSASQGEETMTPAGRDPLTDLPQVTMAKEDLAQRLNLAPEAIEVLEVEMKTWSDASMGCPQPGMAYAQVPQDGLLIRLRVEGKDYNYHSGGRRDPFLCEQPEIPQKNTPVFGEDILTRPPSEDE